MRMGVRRHVGLSSRLTAGLSTSVCMCVCLCVYVCIIVEERGAGRDIILNATGSGASQGESLSLSERYSRPAPSGKHFECKLSLVSQFFRRLAALPPVL